MKYVGWVVEFFLRNAAGASLFFILAGLGLLLQKRGRNATSPVRLVLTALSVFWMGALVALFVNHLRFPLFLDLMEGVVLQHVERLAALQPVYTAPSPEYVPLAYNVGFYVLAVPFSWVLGLSLPTLRLIAMLATIGIGALTFLWIGICMCARTVRFFKPKPSIGIGRRFPLPDAVKKRRENFHFWIDLTGMPC